ncbi:hypothetical protein C7476_11768 [Phyllobacterium bourgognense]|uniref:Uncharacterized protein n=1 Tax=Phyllobacterium bourgognense TaxID=314236 RepID=A0A368YH49_9HYPH|nr:hypothetical protein C7476_11768 [Phyllobacterium bourgognense]
MAFFCGPVLTYQYLRCAPVLENHHFRLVLARMAHAKSS